MLDEGLARYFDARRLGRIGQDSGPRTIHREVHVVERRAHHLHQHERARSAVQLEDGDEHDCTASGSRGTWRTSQCWSTSVRTPALVAECTAFGDSDWAIDRETRRSTTVVLQKLRNQCMESVSYSQTVIALSPGEAEFHRAAAGALQTQLISTGWRRSMRAIVKNNTTAIWISSPSVACKLRHLGGKEP